MKKVRKIMLILLIIIGLIALSGALFVNQAKFGKSPSGARLERLAKSPHYRDGRFYNLIDTPNLSEGVGWLEMMAEFARKKERQRPSVPVPSVKTDLSALDGDSLVWFGHSSFFLRLGGQNILADPVFSPNASPFSFTTKAFDGTNIYSPADLPEIDYLLISHDHWDHLDYPTVTALRTKVKKVICGLGVGAHFEHWGFEPSQIVEGDWFDEFDFDNGLKITLVPARHFSGRNLLRSNVTLWTGFVLETGGRRIFYSGDTGYGPHFKDIGDRFDGFDLAIVEDGQYDRNWKYIHMMPEEVALAAGDLKARAIMPVHNSKFVIANHTWDDPLIRLVAALRTQRVVPAKLVTPIIGQKVDLADPDQRFSPWWADLN